MDFNLTQYQAVVDELTAKTEEMITKAGEIMPAVLDLAGSWFVPREVADALVALGEAALEAVTWLWNRFVDELQGVFAPIQMIIDAFDWGDIKGLADGVASGLTEDVLLSDDYWSGTAQQSYLDATGAQGTHAAKVSSVAGGVATALGIVAAGGLAFYLAAGIIAFQFVTVLIASLTAVGSLVFTWAGLGAVISAAAIDTGLIIGAVAALVALIGAEVGAMISMNADASSFEGEGGTWPKATTEAFNDGTVTDGDAIWSVIDR